jgi:hypothetical protein
MSDDDDRFNWFKDDDDWWVDLITIIRSYVTDPTPVTLGQMKAFSSELTQLMREASPNSPLDLRVLESTLKTHDMDHLSLSSVLALVDVWRDQLGERPQRFKEILDNISVTRLASIVRPKAGTLRAPDVIGLLRLAAQAGKRGKDVLDKLTLGHLAEALGKSALRTITVADLRVTLEAIVHSGLVVDTH